jgi:hypothetical protein
MRTFVIDEKFQSNDANEKKWPTKLAFGVSRFSGAGQLLMQSPVMHAKWHSSFGAWQWSSVVRERSMTWPLEF